MKTKNNILILVLILINAILFSEDKKTNFSGYPFAAYSDETSVMLGAFGVYTTKGDKPDSMNTNQFVSNLIYSFKNQLSFVLIPDMYFKDDIYHLSLPIRVKNWPNSFYGFGSSHFEEERYTEFNTELDFEFERRIIKNVNLGVVANYWYNNVYKTEKDGILKDLDFPGRDKYQVFGFGPLFTYDSRDNKNFPFKGLLYKFKMNFYTKMLGDYEFTKSEHDLRFFIPFSDKQVQGFQLMIRQINGTAPFQKLNDLGENMRGYGSEKYKDENMILVRTENRYFPWSRGFWSRVGFVMFGEMGQLSASIEEFSINDFKFSYGLGLRFKIVEDEWINLKIDFAFGEKGNEFGFSGTEEF